MNHKEFLDKVAELISKDMDNPDQPILRDNLCSVIKFCHNIVWEMAFPPRPAPVNLLCICGHPSQYHSRNISSGPEYPCIIQECYCTLFHADTKQPT